MNLVEFYLLGLPFAFAICFVILWHANAEQNLTVRDLSEVIPITFMSWLGFLGMIVCVVLKHEDKVIFKARRKKK